MSVVIAVETPLTDDIRRLVAALNEMTLTLTPREFTHHLTVEQMAGPDMTLFVARDGTAAVAMGALRRHPGGIGEVKRMYTLPDYRRARHWWPYPGRDRSPGPQRRPEIPGAGDRQQFLRRPACL